MLVRRGSVDPRFDMLRITDVASDHQIRAVVLCAAVSEVESYVDSFEVCIEFGTFAVQIGEFTHRCFGCQPWLPIADWRCGFGQSA